MTSGSDGQFIPGSATGPYFGGSFRRRFFSVPPAADPEYIAASNVQVNIEALSLPLAVPTKHTPRNPVLSSPSFLSATTMEEALRSATVELIEQRAIPYSVGAKLRLLEKLRHNAGAVLQRLNAVLENQEGRSNEFDDEIVGATEFARAALEHPTLNHARVVSDAIAETRLVLLGASYKELDAARKADARDGWKRIFAIGSAATTVGMIAMALFSQIGPMKSRTVESVSDYDLAVRAAAVPFSDVVVGEADILSEPVRHRTISARTSRLGNVDAPAWATGFSATVRDIEESDGVVRRRVTGSFSVVRPPREEQRGE